VKRGDGIGFSEGWTVAMAATLEAALRGLPRIHVKPAPALAKLAKEHAGCTVLKTRIEDLELANRAWGGVWACASLLHLRKDDLPSALRKICRWLVKDGIFYTCFKDGDGERTDDTGRHFTNLTLEEAGRIVKEAGFELHDLWKTDSIIPGRVQVWNNVLATRNAYPAVPGTHQE